MKKGVFLMNPIIETKDLSKKFKNEEVVKNINIKVYPGDIYGFLGPNGAGKSTSIKIMLGLVAPTNGTVLINGYDVFKDREKAIEYVGAMVEAPSFYTYLSGYKNLLLYANIYNQPKERIEEVLEIVGLSMSKNKRVSKYSLGMKQRLAIARAFLNKPKIVILDEPTNGLDPQGVIEIRNLIRELAFREKITFILCSHILTEVQTLCNRLSIIYKGSVIAEGEVDKLLDSQFESYFIETSEADRVKELLSNVPSLSDVVIGANEVKIKVAKGKFSEINSILVLNNVLVNSIKKHEISLEDYFIKAIGE